MQNSDIFKKNLYLYAIFNSTLDKTWSLKKYLSISNYLLKKQTPLPARQQNTHQPGPGQDNTWPLQEAPQFPGGCQGVGLLHP